MKKNWIEIQEMLRTDGEALARAVGGFEGYKKSLEDICSLPVDLKGVTTICGLFGELEDSSELPQKYARYSNRDLDDASPGLSGRLKMITQLESVLYDTFIYTVKDIGNQWKKAKKQFMRWKPDYGMEELKKERTNLASVAELYNQFLQGFDGDLAMHNIGEIQKYIKFVETITSLDAKFALFKEHYLSQDKPTKEELNVRLRDLTDLKKEYERACTINRPIYKRLFTKNSIFEYRERFIEIDNCKEEITNQLAPKPEIIYEPVIEEKVEDSVEVPLPAIQADIISSLMQQSSKEPEKPVPEPIETLLQETQPDSSAYNTTQNQKSGYRPIIRNQTNRFDMGTHLLVIGFPPMTYTKLADTLLGKRESKHEVKKLVPFTEQLKSLSVAGDIHDLDYLYHMEYAIREDMNHGSIDPLIAHNSNYWEIAHTALSTLQDYIQRSEESLGLDPKTIQAHMAITGHANPLNRMFRGM